MNELKSLALEYDPKQGLKILDQRLLPIKEEWLSILNPDEMVVAIHGLQVRGAPLIGVAAALSLADAAFRLEMNKSQLLEAADNLRNARPTAVNLMWAIDRMKSSIDQGADSQGLVLEAQSIFNEDVLMCERIAKNGLGLLRKDMNILTHCNTGGLATAGIGTALGVIRKAAESGLSPHVYVDETRPLLQGGRLTTWELEKLEIPYTLICDGMAAALMAEGKIDFAITGADRIACNGDFANKTGTYGLAVNSFFHKVPFAVAAPQSTIDKSLANGGEIPIEMRTMDEVRGVSGKFGKVQWAPASAVAHNPAFDVTPHELCSAWILDKSPSQVEGFQNGSEQGHFSKGQILDGVLTQL